MKKLSLLTNREYLTVIVTHGRLDTYSNSLEDIFSKKSEDEYIYALQEMADELLDLKKGESVYFSPNRDNDFEKAIILRTK